MHTYFTGLSQAFEVSAIGAALRKDSWATTFYKDKDDDAATALKEILNGIATVVGVVAAFASGPVGSAVGGSAAALAGGVSGAVGPLVGQQ